MSDDILVAIIGLSGVLSVAFVSIIVGASRRVRELEKLVYKDQVRLEILWSIYAEDAVREARKMDMIENKSPAVPTRKWDKITSRGFRQEVDRIIQGMSNGASPREMAIQVIDQLGEGALLDSVTSDVSAASMFGTIYIICARSGK